MRKVLILGAGIYQIPLIKRAIEHGFHVITASWSMNDPGMRISHESFEIDTRDRGKLLALAKEKAVDAVVTTGTDVAVPSIGYICESLGLPGVYCRSALNSANKIFMQERFSAADVPSARYSRAASVEDARKAAESIGLPVVLKAPDSSGSRGISVVEKFDDLENAFEYAINTSMSGEILVEEFFSGEEFGAQLVVLEGEVACFLCHNDTVTPSPVRVPIGHSFPSRLQSAFQGEALQVCISAVKSLEITNAICNADLIATQYGVKILEISPRIGATCIPEIVALHCGLNLYDVALHLALGIRPELKVDPVQAAAALIIRSPATGKLTKMEMPEWVMDMKQVISVSFSQKSGDEVRKFHTGPDRIGDVLVVADTSKNAENLSEKVVGMLEIEVDPAPNEEG